MVNPKFIGESYWLIPIKVCTKNDFGYVNLVLGETKKKGALARYNFIKHQNLYLTITTFDAA